MNILIVSRVLPHHSIGGMQVVAWDLACALAKQQHKVSVLTAEVPGKGNFFRSEDVDVHCMKGLHWSRYGREWRNAVLRHCTAEVLAPYDVILGVSAGAAPLLSMKGSIPAKIIMQAHGTSMGEVLSKWRSRHLLEIAKSVKNIIGVFKNLLMFPRYDSIISIGSAVTEDFGRYPLSLLGGRVSVVQINNGVSVVDFTLPASNRVEVRRELDWTGDQRIVITACRLDRQKGVDLSLRAFERAYRDNADLRYLVIGDGPERKRLESAAANMGLSSVVKFLGSVQRRDVARYLGASDIMLFSTTRVEGLPMNILEALAAGLPCLVSGHVVSKQPICDSVIPIDPHDFDGAAARINDLRVAPLNKKQSLLPEEFTLDYSARAYVDHFRLVSN